LAIAALLKMVEWIETGFNDFRDGWSLAERQHGVHINSNKLMPKFKPVKTVAVFDMWKHFRVVY